MHQAVQRARDPKLGTVIEVVSRPRSAPVRLDVEWESRRDEFRSSLRAFFKGPRPSKLAEGAEALKVEFVEPRLPLRGFVASCVWHIAAIWLLMLPIWGFLPKVQPTLEPPQIELTWYTTPADLPKILLPNSALKSKLAARKPAVAVKAAPNRATEAFHPRQTILSVPVRVTHPRQTLIQPTAPPEPPKMAPDLPNMVQWTASEAPKLQLQLSASAAAPRMMRRAMGRAVAPEILDVKAGGEKLDLLSVQTPKQLAMPLSGPAAKALARQKTPASASNAEAPDVRENSESDSSVRQIIALSSTPAPAAPKVDVPPGNLAARIAMSPKGRKSGEGAGSAAGAASIGADSAMKGGGNLPAAISISGGSSNAKSGEMRSPGKFGLGLTPFSRSNADAMRRSTPARIDVKNISPSLPPETVFSGRQIYTMDVSMPNVTSASGSWILNFAQLDTADDSPMRHVGTLSGPEPVFKVDPKYPPALIQRHVQGEVVLYAIIRKNGSVDSIRVMRSLDPQLDRDAAVALSQWKFRPGTRGGTPVDIEAVVHIPFNYASPAR